MSHIVDAHVAYIKTISDLNQDKAELLERIKRLEEELMDTKNKHAVLVADVVLNEDRAEQIKRLRKANLQLREGAEEQKQRIKRLEDWKESALEIEREWDANAIATMLGAKLGESHRKVIQREVPLLLGRIKRLEEAGDAVAAIIGPPGSTHWADENQVDAAWNNWTKAKDAK